MKVYFHINLGSKNDNQIVTAVSEIKENNKIVIETCLDVICKKLKENARIDLTPKQFEIMSNKKCALSLGTEIISLSNNMDLMVTLKKDVCQTATKYEKTVINKSKATESLVQQKKLNSSTSILSGASANLLAKANDAVSKNLHSTALAAYKEVLKEVPDNQEAFFGIAYIYFKAYRYEECIPYFEKLVSKDSGSYVVLLDYAFALRKNKQESKAVSVISRCISDLKRIGGDVKALHDANVALADALETMDQLPSAFQLYLSISQMTEKQHVDALLGYARVGYKLGHVTLDDVFIVVLNAIALRKNDAQIQSFFSQMIQENGGYESLQKQMHEAWNDAPAVVYIATFLRECGVLDHCLRLLQHAHKIAPKSVDITLLMMHVMENMHDLNPALSLVADFVESKHDRQVIRKIDLSKFAKVIRLHLAKETNELETFVRDELKSLKESPKEASPSGSLANVELQLLAIYFTVIKMFFVKGELQLLPLLLELMKPLYEMNNNLHKTLIRNEQAFFLAISQIFQSEPPANFIEGQQKLFIVGDSHVLPLSWRNLRIKETDHISLPVLLTGLKVWHLRSESNFYTKRSFDKAMQQVPVGATCVFIIGEIDCREGIQRAVQKCAYDSKEECISALVDIYVKCLTSLQKRKKLKLIVHPVPLVLKETRETVDLFNQILRENVSKASKLFWLDINEDLVDDASKLLKEEFNLDGAHLHPKYSRLVEKSLEKYL